MAEFDGVFWERARVRYGLAAGKVTRVWRVAVVTGVRANLGDLVSPYVVGERYALAEMCRAEELDDGLDGVRYRMDGAFVAIENSQDASDAWIELRGMGDWLRGGWAPARAMPLWAARYAVTVEDLAMEKLQALTDDDVRGAGAQYVDFGGQWRGWTFDTLNFGASARDAFRRWWDKGHPLEDGGWTWDANPWVWKATVRVERIGE